MNGRHPNKDIERLLDEARLWPLSSYGWRDENTADPDFIGHAMWQIEPPISDERFFWTYSARRGTPPPPAPTDRQKFLMTSGTDFEGLMAWARLSIGIVLSQASGLLKNIFSDETFFEMHRASALIYLSTASDRIRDFFVMAVFNKPRAKYDGQRNFSGEPRGRFKTAFEEALQTVDGQQDIAKCFAALVPLAEEIERLRRLRNEMVHELATEAARRERQHLGTPPVQADPDIDFGLIQEAARKQEQRQKERLNTTVGDLLRWYELLVKFSNEAFIVEHRLRA
ncbi:hypothetical protein [Bradyrhizobium sp. Cp5.3]|uniref:hypothetical protein n=1 Tax=Bradyrhizobium sp. Cp5.3 TaxID=443598 RepID=UPI000401E291|nr:hypothetical protein [Bradyrhizobium sp. Cp5.3]